MNRYMPKYECDNCGHIDNEATLIPEIKHYYERVDDEGPAPSGECSECGCLTYEVENGKS